MKRTNQNTVRWLWRVTGKKKGYILALTLIQGAAGLIGVAYALLLREGLTPYAEVAVGSKRLCRAVRVGSFLSLMGSVLGTLLAFYLTFVSAQRALSPLTMLAYLLLWAVAALIDGFFVDRY